MTLRVSRFAPACLTSLLAVFACGSAQADEVQVAVAANFTAPIQAIAAGIEPRPPALQAAITMDEFVAPAIGP